MKHYLPGRSDKKTKGEGLSPGSLTSGRPSRGMLGLWLGVKAALGTSRFQPPCLSVSRLSSPPADGSVHHEMVSLPRAGAVCDREWASHSEEDTREAARLAVRGGGESGREGGHCPGRDGLTHRRAPAGASSLEPRCLLQKTPLVGLVFSKFSVLVKPTSVS